MTERTSIWLTVSECLSRISVARSTWDKWRQRGDAPAATRLPNGQLRINETHLQQWLDAHAEEVSPIHHSESEHMNLMNEDTEHDYWHFRMMLNLLIPTAIEFAKERNWLEAKAAIEAIKCPECAFEALLEVVALSTNREQTELAAATILEERYGFMRTDEPLNVQGEMA